MRVLRPGQTFENATVQIVIVEGDMAHAWEVTDASVNWDMTGTGPTGRTTAKIDIHGELRRKTKPLPMSSAVIDDPLADAKRDVAREAVERRRQSGIDGVF